MSSYLIAAARTPLGKFLGSFASLTAPQLAAIALREALARSGLPADKVDEVILGQVVSAGAGQAPARQAALAAGIPPTVPALTINKVCGSGLKAVMLADQAIRAGDANIILAGGMESMSRAPHLVPGSREGTKFGQIQLLDSLLYDGLRCAIENESMGVLADATAEEFDISRAEQDAFALESHLRALAAQNAGKFAAEIVPVSVRSKKGTVEVARDEGPRPDSSLAALSQLPAAFGGAGTVTAGNSSQMSDGAAALVVASERVARDVTSPIRARIVAAATSGTAPKDLFIAPVAAVRNVLAKASLQTADIDLFEVNEAFAAQMLACNKQLRIDPSRLNVHGGAIALGHPIGASGARVLVTLLYALADRGLRRGLATLCLGGGNAVSLIVERD